MRSGVDLRARVLAEARCSPGVYRFLGPRREVLYVGKSVQLRRRLLSHFSPAGSAKQVEMIRVARSVEWEYVPNEFEALLREFRLIRAFRPRFNKRHRHERRYAWIRLTRGDAPRLAATRNPRPDGSRYFGPFPAPAKLPGILDELAAVVGLRDCSDRTPMRFTDQLEVFQRERTPGCARADLGTCPAPCAALCSVAEYRENIRTAVQFLSGRSDAPLERLEALMHRASERREFELAGRLCRRSERLEDLRDRVVTFRDQIAALTCVYRVASDTGGTDRGYVLAAGRVLMSFDFTPDGAMEASTRQRAVALLRGPIPTPAEIDAESREETFLVTRWFRNRPDERERTLPIEGC